MPTGQELLGILVAIVILWIILKVAKVAIRLILFFIGLVLVGGVLYFMFMR
jgi:hypothetical protein